MALTIAQLSDIHCGSVLYEPSLMERAVEEILDLEPDLVIVAGDLTQEGYADEFQQARDALRPLQEALLTVVVPGNHDAKNVGFVHFEDHFGKGMNGKADRVVNLRREDDPRQITVLGIDSSKPDLAEGEIGRERYDWITSVFAEEADLKIFALHHHLVSVPGTGRERNIVWDAGDVLELLEGSGVDLVLAGHKHVPHVWSVGDLLLVNSGTVSSYRTRGYTRPSYNVVQVTETEIDVTLVYPGSGQKHAANWDREGRRLTRNPELGAMFSKEAWGW